MSKYTWTRYRWGNRLENSYDTYEEVTSQIAHDSREIDNGMASFATAPVSLEGPKGIANGSELYNLAYHNKDFKKLREAVG